MCFLLNGNPGYTENRLLTERKVITMASVIVGVKSEGKYVLTPDCIDVVCILKDNPLLATE